MSADAPEGTGPDDPRDTESHVEAGSDTQTADSAVDITPILDDHHPILLFDGVCNLCNGAVRFVIRFDAAGTFRFAPLQSEVGQALLAHYDRPTDEFDSFVLIEDGDIATKSTAALRVAQRLDGPWPLLFPLIYLPERIRDWAYDLVADYRYRVFGRKDECPIPEPEIRDRFADQRLD